jgi:hypothetical protein
VIGLGLGLLSSAVHRGTSALSSWDQGAAWKERWRIDDPDAALWQDVDGTIPAAPGGSRLIATVDPVFMPSEDDFVQAGVPTSSGPVVYKIKLDPVVVSPFYVAFGSRSVFGPTNPAGAMQIFSTGAVNVGAGIFSPTGTPVAAYSAGAIADGEHRMIWYDPDAGKVWLGNDAGPTSGDPEAGTGAHFTCAPGTDLAPQVRMTDSVGGYPADQTATIVPYSSGRFADPGVQWERAAKRKILFNFGDPVLRIGGMYAEGALVTASDGSTIPLHYEALGDDGPYYIGDRYQQAYSLRPPASMYGVLVDIGIRTPLGVYVFAFRLTPLLPKMLYQEIIVRYPSNPAAHGLMRTFLEEHNTVEFVDTMATSHGDRMSIGTFYGAYYGGGEYHVITDGDSTITMTGPNGDSTTIPPFEDYYGYGPVVNFGDSVTVSIEHPDELTDVELAFGALNANFLGPVSATSAFVINAIHGTPLPASQWPAEAKVLVLKGGNSMMGSFTDINLPAAANKDVMETLGLVGQVSGRADVRQFPAMIDCNLNCYGLEGVNAHGLANLPLLWFSGNNVQYDAPRFTFFDIGGCTSLVWNVDQGGSGHITDSLVYVDLSGANPIPASPGGFEWNFSAPSNLQTFLAVGCNFGGTNLNFSDSADLTLLDFHGAAGINSLDAAGITSAGDVEISLVGTGFTGAGNISVAGSTSVKVCDLTGATGSGAALHCQNSGLTSLLLEDSQVGLGYIYGCGDLVNAYMHNTQGVTTYALDQLITQLDANGFEGGVADLRVLNGVVRSTTADISIASLAAKDFTILQNVTFDPDNLSSPAALTDYNRRLYTTDYTLYGDARSHFALSSAPFEVKFIANYTPGTAFVSAGLAKPAWSPIANAAYFSTDAYFVSKDGINLHEAFADLGFTVDPGDPLYVRFDPATGYIWFDNKDDVYLADAEAGISPHTSVPPGTALHPAACCFSTDDVTECGVTIDQTSTHGRFVALEIVI